MTDRFTKIFNEIASSLNITRGVSESSPDWIGRIIYSAAGRSALYSLYDHLEDEESVSITHFKARARRELVALCSAGNLTSITEEVIQDICDEVYNEYVNTGYVYHLPNRIEPAPEKAVLWGHVSFVRGMTFDNRAKSSGIGYYLLPSEKNNNNSNVEASLSEFYKMFHISRVKLDDYYQKLVDRKSWQLFHAVDNIEYLRTSGSFSRGYWNSSPDKDGNISLLRVGLQGERIYYLYRYENNHIYVSVLPDWMTNNYEYRQIATCLLSHRDVLPDSAIRVDKNIVQLNIGYLYPPSIQNVIMLYSWPKSLNNVKTVFNRVMTRPVWESIRSAIEPLGYKIREELS